MKKKPSRKAGKSDVLSPFRNKLWDLFKHSAKGMDGADVVVALKQAGEEIWAAGIDGTYSDMPLEDQAEKPLGNAFDVAWLTVVCIKLKRSGRVKSPRCKSILIARPRRFGSKTIGRA